MKTLTQILTCLALALSPISAMANCTTHTYWIDGKFITCNTCCYGGNCNTTCF